MPDLRSGFGYLPVTQFEQAYEHARSLHGQGRLADAERAYRDLLAGDEHREEILRALVELYLQARRPQEAIDTLVTLTQIVPDRLYYYARLAALLEGLGQVDAAIGQYQRLLQRVPGHANAYFNLALLYRNDKRYQQALEAYQDAIRHGIDNVQEAWCNMGVLYSELRRGDEAREMYQRALAIEPGYIPALFNLASLHEEQGERQRAVELYQNILELNPRYWDALSRLVQAQKISDANRGMVDTLRRATEEARADPLSREGLFFALGKALDDLENYQEAFAAYQSANELGMLRNPPYNRDISEQAFNLMSGLFTRDRIRNAAGSSEAAPVFICGMFRSGSTLVEQILATHPAVTPGGELDYLPWLAARHLAPYPERVRDASRQEFETLANAYLARLQDLFPGAGVITDKRPDNFLYLGLIKILFPRARIIYTRRNPMDNCLSVYFQQLGGNLAYTTDLDNIAHYYQQHLRLMQHWTACFGDDIFNVDYEELIHAPEPVLRGLLGFLGLEWDDRCLSFQETGNLVKTASVWQVREELHSRSSGRWRHYAPFMPDLEALLNNWGD